jgi:hypothetical protein
VVHGILGFFRHINDEDSGLLRQGVAGQDCALIGRASYRMLGASRSIGARDFGQTCEAIHRASRTGDWQAIEAALQPFEAQLRRLDAYIDRLAGAGDG